MLSFSNFVLIMDDYFFLLEDFFLPKGGLISLLADYSYDSTVCEMFTDGGGRRDDATE